MKFNLEDRDFWAQHASEEDHAKTPRLAIGSEAAFTCSLSPVVSAQNALRYQNRMFADATGERAGVRGLELLGCFPLSPKNSDNIFPYGYLLGPNSRGRGDQGKLAHRVFD